MIRPGQPKHKICRRAGFCLWNDPKCPTNRGRQYPAGQHGRKNFKRSDYYRMLLEKQKLKFTYNLSEKQFKRTFQRAKQMRGVTAENLVALLETRLDAIVWRSGLARSPFQARQLVSHGHFLVDWRPANIPSMQIRPGQVVAIRPKSRDQEWAQLAVEQLGECRLPYLEVNVEEASVRLKEWPRLDQVPLGPIDVQQTISFYSRV